MIIFYFQIKSMPGEERKLVDLEDRETEENENEKRETKIQYFTTMTLGDPKP